MTKPEADEKNPNLAWWLHQPDLIDNKTKNTYLKIKVRPQVDQPWLHVGESVEASRWFE